MEEGSFLQPNFFAAKPFGPEKCPLYLRAQWIGSASQQLEYHIKTAFRNCYGAVAPRTVFLKPMHATRCQKQSATYQSKSMVIYEYVCRCDSQYVGCTARRFLERIMQYAPKAIKAIRQKATPIQEHGTHRSQPTRTRPNRKHKAKSNT